MGDASDAACLVDDGEEVALSRGEPSLILGFDGDEHRNVAAHHLRRDGDAVKADGVAGAGEDRAGMAAEAIGHEPAGAVVEAADVVAPKACGAAAQLVNDGPEDVGGLTGGPALPTGPTSC